MLITMVNLQCKCRVWRKFSHCKLTIQKLTPCNVGFLHVKSFQGALRVLLTRKKKRERTEETYLGTWQNCVILCNQLDIMLFCHNYICFFKKRHALCFLQLLSHFRICVKHYLKLSIIYQICVHHTLYLCIHTFVHGVFCCTICTSVPRYVGAKTQRSLSLLCVAKVPFFCFDSTSEKVHHV